MVIISGRGQEWLTLKWPRGGGLFHGTQPGFFAYFTTIASKCLTGIFCNCHSFYEPNFIKKFLWESGFSNFRRNQNDTKWKLVICPPFWNGKSFFVNQLFNHPPQLFNHKAEKVVHWYDKLLIILFWFQEDFRKISVERKGETNFFTSAVSILKLYH